MQAVALDRATSAPPPVSDRRPGPPRPQAEGLALGHHQGPERNTIVRNTEAAAGRRPGQRRSSLQREAHRTRLSELLVKRPGITQRQMADDLGVNVATVNRDLQALRREWAAQRLENGDALVGRQLARLERQQAEAFRAWERSLADVRTERAVERRTERRLLAEVAGVDGREGGEEVITLRVPVVEVRTTRVLTVRTSLGDPRFLQQHLQANVAITELLGLNEPRQFALGRDKSGDAVQVDAVGDLAELLAAAERVGVLDPAVLEAAEQSVLAAGDDDESAAPRRNVPGARRGLRGVEPRRRAGGS